MSCWAAAALSRKAGCWLLGCAAYLAMHENIPST